MTGETCSERAHRTARHVPGHSRALVIGSHDGLAALLIKEKSCQVSEIKVMPLDIKAIPATFDYDTVVVSWSALSSGVPHELLIACRRALSRDGSLIIVAPNAAFKDLAEEETERATSKRQLFRSIHDAGLLVVESEGIGTSEETPTPVKTGVLLSNASETHNETVEELGVEAYILHTVPIKSHRHHQLLRLKEVHVDRELIRLNAEVRRQRNEVRQMREQQQQFLREVRLALQLADDKARFFRTEIEEGLLLLAHRVKTEHQLPVTKPTSSTEAMIEPPLPPRPPSLIERLLGKK